MILCLHFVERIPGYPGCDLLNKQLMQTGAARYADVDQAAKADGKDDLSIRGGSDR